MTRPIQFILTALLSFGSYINTEAKAEGSFSQVSADSFCYNLNSGKLRIPAGFTYEGDIHIAEGASVENYGTLRGKIYLEGGVLTNNGFMQPEEICLKSGRFSNYGSFSYDKDISTGNSALNIENYGDMKLNKDLMLNNTKLILFGNCSIRNLMVMEGSRVELYGHSTLRLNDLEVYDSLIVVNPTAKIGSRNIKVHNTGFVEANGAITLEQAMKIDGKVFVNDDIQVGKILSVEENALFAVSANTQAWVGEKISNNSAYFLISGTLRVEGELDNMVTASLLDEGKIYVKELKNYGTISGNGDGNRSLRVADKCVNRGCMKGSFDYCDSSISKTDLNTGEIASSVSLCAYTPASKLISFTAENNSTFVTLRWTTAREENSSHFEVEQMENDNGWVVIAKIQGMGSSVTQQNYVFSTIVESNPSVAYYRLRQVDQDGKFEYSPVVKIQFDVVKPADAVIISKPESEEIVVAYKSKASSRMKVELLDSRGSIIKNLNTELKEGSNNIRLKTKDLSNGVYFLKMEANGKTEILKVVR